MNLKKYIFAYDSDQSVYVSHECFKLFQMDVKSVILSGYLNEEVYGHQPHGFENLTKSNHVFKLTKALY